MDDRRGNLPIRDLLDARLKGNDVIDLLEFLESTYSAAATLAEWDRERLERPHGGFGDAASRPE